MNMKAIGVPKVSTIKRAAMDYAVGLGGGLLYNLLSKLTGSGFLGGLISGVVTGAVIQGERGTALACILGFQSMQQAATAAPAAASNGDGGTM